MKVIIDSSNKEDLEVTECLEPTFTSYRIRQGSAVMQLSDYQAKELVRALNFLLKQD